MEVFFIMGLTNTGKTTLIDELTAHDTVAACQVGKEFRRRYPAGHFKGKGAPSHTEQEAIDILAEQLDDVTSGTEVILVDGQPRQVSQIEIVFQLVWDRWPKANAQILWLHEDDLVLKARAEERATNAEELDLSLQRLKNDRIQLYDVIYRAMYEGYDIYPASYDQAIHEVERCLS